ncbi:pseudaminic acid biosynthesis-associated methylase [Fluviicola chungangensis]|uniref:Pseudaminic acid biosynthesis-associated methylase n=1 Tax=Fluviicola chungangensis TaxID=2597671 RepID=A0A556MPX7_9FLAO|nr:pseudaminic acid biosynthesis-associated methylase [Fluviicola chungangensis]TSJ41993.1 pseudaminic acid biosynthesis-associated methylase [Fluviicola chungangensis]
MSAIYKTEQEDFWAGDFGTEYIDRNKSEQYLASNIHFFSKALKQAAPIDSLIEFGANVGMNLKAIRSLYPNLNIHAIEINENAAGILKGVIGENKVYNCSILDFEPKEKYSVSLIKGVLIHINPEMLELVYRKLYDSSNKYILVAEYYNPTPVAINYRGHSDRLFKRDFAGEMMQKFPDLKLIDYGFVYKNDPSFPQDDVTWFLMEKK